MRNHWTEIEKYLEDQKIAQELIENPRDFHACYEGGSGKGTGRKSGYPILWKKILEMSIVALGR